MIHLLKKMDRNPLTSGLALLYVLPPIGMAWFIVQSVLKWKEMIQRRRPVSADPVGILLLMMIFASIGAALSRHQYIDFLSTLVLTGYFIIYLFMHRQPESLHLRRFVWVTIFGGIYLYVSERIFEHFSFDSAPGQVIAFMTGHQPFGYLGHGRLFGSAFNPNYACYLLILSLAFLSVELLRAIRSGDRRTIILSLILLPFLDLAIYQTESRAGIVIMAFLHLLFLYKLSRRVFVPVFAVSLLASPLLYRLMPRADNTELSLGKRIAIWKNSLHIFTDNPVFGATSFGFREDYVVRTGHMIPHAHDLFLAIFSISGLFCGSFFIAVVVWSVYNLIKLQRIGKQSTYQADLFLFALPTIIMYGLMDYPLSSPQIMIIFLAIMSYWVRYMRRVKHLSFLHRPSWHMARSHVRQKRSEAVSIQSLKGPF